MSTVKYWFRRIGDGGGGKMHKIPECRPMILSGFAPGSNLFAQNLLNFASEHEYRFAGYVNRSDVFCGTLRIDE